jgi:hypothetical protein
MAVCRDIREAEKEIDEWIVGLSYWYAPRDILLERLLTFYRDAIEVFFVHASYDVLRNRGTAIGALEDRMRAGVFPAIKWAMELCHVEGRGRANLDPKGIHRLVRIGELYEVLVDIITSAQADAVSIDVIPRRRLLLVHQGADLTGSDDALVEHQRRTNAYHGQVSFVEDGDQLTRRWTAGDFRRLAQRLASSPQIERCSKICLSNGSELFTRPTVLELPDVSDDEAEQRVLEDLTLTPAMITSDSRQKWRLVSQLDVPFVRVGSRRLGTSDAVIAMTGALGEDHMVRRAVQVDPDQYSKVSGLREARMIAALKPRLETKGWRVTPHHRLHNPDNEIDIFAERASSHLVLGLKSTVRPLTPGEVRLRNEDIISGVNHTADMSERLSPAVGFVITNGYRGDYATWEVALRRNVMIGTVEDIEAIAADPTSAADALRVKVGFGNGTTVQQRLRPPARFRLGRWNIELTA